MTNLNFIDKLKRITAMADTGLLYASSEYEKERYEELKTLSLEMVSEIISQPLEKIENYFLPIKDYPTVKVDVRGLVLNEKKEILFVKEQSDSLWALPGGWADIGFSPSEAICKEVWEEAGFMVKPVNLLALFDNRLHPYPPQPYYIYKIIMHCEIESGFLNKGFDILDCAFFNILELPTLSINRIVKSQIEVLYKRALEGVTETLFD